MSLATILLTVLACLGMIALCEQWDRTSRRRWQEGREARRAENRAWWDRQHVRQMARWQAEAAAAARWATVCARHPRLANLLPWGVALLIVLGLVLLAARLA